MAKIISLEDKKKDGKVEKSVPKYDHTKSYSWKSEDDFVLTGNEFGLLYQIAKAEVSIPGGVSIKDKMAAFELLENILKQAVEGGVAIEIPEEIEKEKAPN